MCKTELITYLSSDKKTTIHAMAWIPEGEVRAILQISHGMVEYIERYEHFGRHMAERGVLVVGNDHLGHGGSVRSKEDYGYFAEEKGNLCLIRDMHKLRGIMQREYPKVPYFLLGHSMGSFLARQYISCHGKGLAGAIIMGTGVKSRALAKTGMDVCEQMAKVKGWRYRSKLIDSMAFGGYNKGIPNPRTAKDWLTRNEEIVDAYLAEERCSFLFTLNGYYNLFLSVYKLTFESYTGWMPRKLPVFFMAGAADPVGNCGKDVEKVAEEFRRIGMRDVQCRLYQDDRHEILNELDRENVYGDIYDWIVSSEL